jgi:hypothetical protein
VLPFFPRLLVLGMVTHPELSTHAIDLADTHMQVKTLSQFHLNGGTRCLRSLATLFFKKGSHRSTQLAGVAMPSILQGSFTSLPYSPA